MADGHRLSSSRLPHVFFVVFFVLLRTLVLAARISPPDKTFCLFATGELIFEDRMKKIAPSAKSGGIGTIAASGAHVRRKDDGTITLQRMYGAVWYISVDEKDKVLEAAYDRMFLADFETKVNYDHDNSDRMQCLCMDHGILPHAFPLPIYTEFPRELDVGDYTDRLKQIGAPADYISWLYTLTAVTKDTPTPAYIRPPSFHPPRPQDTCSPIEDDDPGPQYKEYPVPSGKLCVVFADELIFEDVMKKLATSATTIGAAMFWDRFIALGGNTVPGKSPQYKGYDRIWGVGYLIDQSDFETLKKYGVKHSFYIAKIKTILKDEYQTDCASVDIGLLPSGFPFQVYQETSLELKSYLKQLSTVGVPSGYVNAIERLASLLKKSDQPNGLESIRATYPTSVTNEAAKYSYSRSSIFAN